MGWFFCKILSEIVEIWNGKPHCWTCCYFRLFSPLQAGCFVKRVTAFVRTATANVDQGGNKSNNGCRLHSGFLKFLTALDNPGKEWLQIFLSVSAVLQGVGDTVEQEASVDPYIKPLKHALTCANTISKNRIHNTLYGETMHNSLFIYLFIYLFSIIWW